jgi:SAM-dependent methyltransferase
MWLTIKRTSLTFLTLTLIPVAFTAVAQQSDAPAREPDIFYVPTPPEVVDAMLKVAKVGPNDIVYDLGSGDGRIPIAAARDYGAKGVGIDIDPQRVKEARDNAVKNNVTDRVNFIVGDLYEANFSDATVVTLYLLTDLNIKLRPKLMKDLKPGTRIVSHAFGMGDWEPLQTLDIDGHKVYYWEIPASQ